MSTLNDVEATLEGWYKNVPHLPTAGRVWLADNIWWLAMIGAILSILGLFTVVPFLLTVFTVGSFVAMTSMHVSSVAAYGSMFWLSILISIVSYLITMVLLIASVTPLKQKAKQGWRLLFLTYMVNFVLSVINAVISFAPGSLVSAIISAAIGGYLLFEIRSYFVTKRKVVKKAKAAK